MATQKSKNEGARQMVTFSQGLNDLATAWAEVEGRTLGSVLTYALELGLRSAMKSGEIPRAAISKYNLFCEERRREAEDEREKDALRKKRISERRPQSEDELAELLEIEYWGSEQGIEWDDEVHGDDPFYQVREDCRREANRLWKSYKDKLLGSSKIGSIRFATSTHGTVSKILEEKLLKPDT